MRRRWWQLEFGPPVVLQVALVTALATVTTGAAEARTRVAVLLAETIEGKPAVPSTAEAALIALLIKNPNLDVVDAAQARKVRAVYGDTFGSDESLNGVMTALEVDLLLVGSATLDHVEPTVRGLIVFQASGQLRVITSDSARVLKAVSADALGRDPLSPAPALRAAARQLAEKLHAAVQPLPLKAPAYQLALSLTGGSDPAFSKRLRDSIAALPGVSEVSLDYQSKQSIRLQVSSTLSKLELADALHGLPGIRIYGFSSARLDGEFTLGDMMKVEVVGSPLTNKLPAAMAGRPLYRHLPATIAERLLGALAQLDVLDVPPGALLTRRAALAPHECRVALEGRLEASGDRLILTAGLRATAAPRRLLEVHGSCPQDDIEACVVDVSAQLREGVRARVTSMFGRRCGAQRPSRQDDVLLSYADVQAVFPSLGSFYSDHPLGSVRVTNRSKAHIDQVHLSVLVDGLTQAPGVIEVGRLDPGAQADVPLRLALDPVALVEHSTPAVHSMRIRGYYRRGDTTFLLEDATRITVYDLNAHLWRPNGGERVAAFVSHRAPNVRLIVDQAYRAVGELTSQHPLAIHAALFTALRGLRYQSDPADPYDPDRLDHVLYPEQTLAQGGGDCDDLSVLYAALLEGAGIPALLIRTPNHVLVAGQVQVASGQTALLGQTDKDTLVYEGRVWVPVEMTLPNATFTEAWAAGAARLTRSPAEPVMTPVRAGWRDGFRPSAPSVSPSSWDRLRPDLEAVRAAVAPLVEAARQRVDAALAALQDAVDGRALNRAGIVVARAGRTSEARAAFERCLQLDDPAGDGSFSSFVLNNLGNVAMLEQDPLRALTQYERALEILPKSEELHVNAFLAAVVLRERAPTKYEGVLLKHRLSLCQISDALCDELVRQSTELPETTAGTGIPYQLRWMD
jgi:hypothetical protein